MLILVAALVLAQVDAGDAVSVHKAVLDEQLPDGGVGRRLVVVGGCWLSDAYCVGFAGELADLRAQNRYLKEHAPDAPYGWLVAIGAAGVALGAAAGFCGADPGHCGVR